MQVLDFVLSEADLVTLPPEGDHDMTTTKERFGDIDSRLNGIDSRLDRIDATLGLRPPQPKSSLPGSYMKWR
jgi:hypothetical protein